MPNIKRTVSEEKKWRKRNESYGVVYWDYSHGDNGWITVNAFADTEEPEIKAAAYSTVAGFKEFGLFPSVKLAKDAIEQYFKLIDSHGRSGKYFHCTGPDDENEAGEKGSD